MNKLLIIGFAIIAFLIVACRNNSQPEKQRGVVITKEVDDSITIDLAQDSFPEVSITVVDSIYGDTVWVYPYGIQLLRDTILTSAYVIYMSVWVDTTDFLVDTVMSKKGNRIVIGYNHYYKLEFWKKGKKWFTSEFNKREQLADLLEGTEYWLESNLDVFQHIHFNDKYEKFVVEFDINPRYNYGSVYYLVISTSGEIEHMGTSNSWGGGGPDGDSFLSLDMTSFISCFEMYNFEYNVSITVAEYVMLAENRLTGETAPLYKQIHALRKLNGDNFLVIFNQYRGKPEFNGLVLSMDTTILQRFRYYGLMEEMDAMLLFIEKSDINRFFLYDTEREVLICINEKDTVLLNEFSISKMLPPAVDSIPDKNYTVLDFEAFGSYRFFMDTSLTKIYREVDGIE